jgi:hypothetical protein
MKGTLSSMRVMVSGVRGQKSEVGNQHMPISD